MGMNSTVSKTGQDESLISKAIICFERSALNEVVKGDELRTSIRINTNRFSR